MTKKHYIEIAKIIKANYEEAKTVSPKYRQTKGIELLTSDIMEYFSKENPQFDGERFLIACGIN